MSDRDQTARGKSLQWPLIGAVIVASAILMAWHLARVETDDAFSVLRYARNLIDGHVLSFNLDDRICAFTSPLHVLLLAAIYRFTGELHVTNKMVGAAGLLVSAAVVAMTFRRKPAALCVALALLVASPYVLMWTFGGLETALLLASLTSLTVVAAQGPLSSRQVIAGCILGGVSMVTRLDSAVFVAPLVATLLSRTSRRLQPIGFLFLVLLPLAWSGFAKVYYGTILPTSFYVKTPHLSGLHWMVSNALYSVEFWTLSGTIVVWIGAAIRLSAVEPDSWRDHWSRCKGIYLGLAGLAIYALAAATTHLFYAFRLFVPFLGPAAILVAELIARLDAVANRRLLAAAVGVVLVLQLVNYGQLVGQDGNVSGARNAEFRDLSFDSVADITRSLGAPAEAIRLHWLEQAGHSSRPMRLSTFAIGILPFELSDAIVYEEHISYRAHCRPIGRDLDSTVDYVLTMNGKAGARPPVDSAVKIFSTPFKVGSLELQYEAWFNPHPSPPFLPPRVGDTCRLPPH